MVYEDALILFVKSIMQDPFNDKEWIEALDLLEHFKNDQLVEELERLAEREKKLSDRAEENSEEREIAIYNFTVLIAAIGRIKLLMDTPDNSSDSEQTS